MTLKIIEGNIFTSKASTIVNTVNTVGVMGAGIALECRLRYPDMFIEYQELCKKHQIDIGQLWLYDGGDRSILNFPTKRHWKYLTKPEYLHKGLQEFLNVHERLGISEIAFPLLGASNGGLDPEESLDIMESYLKQVHIEVEIYEYSATAPDDLYEKTKEWVSSQDTDEIAEKTGLRRNYVEKVKDAISSPAIVQLNQLAQVPGIGIKTLEKVFSASMRRTDAGADQDQGKLF